MKLRNLKRRNKELITERAAIQPNVAKAKEDLDSIGRRLASLQSDYNEMRNRHTTAQAREAAIADELIRNITRSD